MIAYDETIKYDYLQDDLVRAILYPFAMSNYDGIDSVAIRSILSSEIFQTVDPEVINEAFDISQNAGLVCWDEGRIGALKLTVLGIEKLHLVRKDFFDDEEFERLEKSINSVKPIDFTSDWYRQIKTTCTGLGAWSQQPCLISGHWLARRLLHQRMFFSAGVNFPVPEYDGNDDPIIWYLLR